MRFLPCCFAVLAISLVLLPARFPASAGQNVNIQTYWISGTNAEELQKQLWGRFDGDNAGTTWKVSWHYVERVTSEACTPARVTTSIDVQFIFPEWTDETLAPTRLQTKWRRYLAALKRHQDGHKDIGLTAAHVLRLTIQGMGAKDCVKLKAAVDMAAKEIIARYRQIEQDYDIKTNNGAAQGADIKNLE